MRFDQGWITLDRALLTSYVAKDNFTLGLFVRMLLMANWKDGSTSLAGQKVKLRRGDLATGLRELSPNQTEDPHLHRVRTSLRHLENGETIAQTTSNQGRVVKILNYEHYQDQDRSSRRQSADDAQTDRKPSANEAQHSEPRTKNKESSNSPISHPLMEIWNQNRGRLPGVRGLSGKRKKSADARWSENPSAEYWISVVKRLAASSFCRGERNDPDGGHANWKADFDFLVKPDTHLKVLEGKYDDKQAPVVELKTDLRVLQELANG